MTKLIRNRTFATAALGAIALFGGARQAAAAPITLSSTVGQSGYFDLQNQANYPLTAGAYDYTGQAYNTLTSLDSITVTLSVNDGDTGFGEYDYNSLTLALDGIDTGLLLNGFLTDNTVTLDLTGVPNLAAAILAALKADGMLVGSVLDATPGNAPQDDFLGFSRLLDTTLDLTGAALDAGNGNGGGQAVPLPAAVLIAPLGAGIAGAVARRFRKAK